MLEYASIEPLAIGITVEVTVKHHRTLGIIWGESERIPSRPETIKAIETLYPDISFSSQERLFIEDISRYYHQSVGCMAHLAFPPHALAYFQKAPRALKKSKGSSPSPPASQANVLTPAQQIIVRNVLSLTTEKHFQTHLLYGITGSGKTEVYRHLARETIKQGFQVLWLVPEIKLTPQLLEHLAPEWSGHMETLHSHLTPAQRFTAWNRARQGKSDLIIGTRLAVFTPLPRLGLIIVDEEHDASFSQNDQIRYHARDVAIWRAKHFNCPIILGSATPSLESYVNATLKQSYRLHTLTERAITGAQLPTLKLVSPAEKQASLPWSPVLDQGLHKRLERNEQSLIFLNRRGYAPTLYCAACQWVAECNHCSSRLVWHKNERRIRCHHCGAQQGVPKTCPRCGHPDIFPMGLGTQQLEEALQHRFPEARILRVDQDSMRQKKSWENALKVIASGQVDILVGTQMLAKGHHFPRLSLVGILGTDDALYSADYRSSELVFSQLLQVAGRAGRASLPGEVLIETHYPDHPLFQCVIQQDYAQAAQSWIIERQQAKLPPFSYWALFWAESKQVSHVVKWMQELYQYFIRDPLLQPLSHAIHLSQPMPALMEKRIGWYRYYMLIQSHQRPSLHRCLNHMEKHIYAAVPRTIRWRIDVDPQSL